MTRNGDCGISGNNRIYLSNLPEGGRVIKGDASDDG
jgi:hypothetical protein